MDVKVVMIDGRVFEGPLWEWRPLEGWFTLVIDDLNYPNAPDRFRLRDVVSAVDRNQRVSVDRLAEDVDLLVRARLDGWDGS